MTMSDSSRSTGRDRNFPMSFTVIRLTLIPKIRGRGGESGLSSEALYSQWHRMHTDVRDAEEL